MVDLGINRRNPDYYALEVMNELFGGGFSFTAVCQHSHAGRGWHIPWAAAWARPSIIRDITASPWAPRVAPLSLVLRRCAKKWNKLITGTVKPIEMKKAKDSILNSFIFEFDSKEKVLAERMRYEFYGFPPDFLEQYRANIEKVTAADVDRVARKYIHPDKMAVLVVGNAKDFDRALSTLGTVTPVDISIPQKKAEK